MILYGCTEDVERIVTRGEYGHPPSIQKSGVGRRRVDRVKKSRVACVTITDRA